jgi:hypothetical protein
MHENRLDAVTMRNHTRPGGTTPETVLVVRDLNQLRSPDAASDPRQRSSANLLTNLLASPLGAGVLAPNLLPIPQPQPMLF